MKLFKDILLAVGGILIVIIGIPLFIILLYFTWKILLKFIEPYL